MKIQTYRSQHLKKSRRQLPSELAGTCSENAQWKGESPPADVEGKFLAPRNRRRCGEELHESKGPEYQRGQEAHDVERRAGRALQDMSLWKYDLG